MNKFFSKNVCMAAIMFGCLLPAVGLAEKMVVVSDQGQLLDLESEKVKALAKEKVRIAGIKKQVIKSKLLPEEMVRQIFEPMIEPNKKQFEQNVRNSKRFRDMAQQAAERTQTETAQKYMQVAKLFYEYSLRNKAIVNGFAKGASGEINQACEEILAIEKQIRQISRKDVPRDWLTPQEVNSVNVMTEKQYEAMQEARRREEASQADEARKTGEGRPPNP